MQPAKLTAREDPSLNITPDLQRRSTGNESRVPNWLNIVMLLLICMMNLGNYYCFDLPQTLQTPF